MAAEQQNAAAGALEPTATPEDFVLDHEVAETELVFGLVGALGTDMDRVSEELHLALDQFGYRTAEIRLSKLLREVDWEERLDEDNKLDAYIAAHMDAGNRLRQEWDRPDALALLATAKIATAREANLAAGEPHTRRAWLLRQLKTPKEVQTLREVYGSRFFLIAAYTPDDERASWLAEAISKSRHTTDRSKWDFDVAELLRRDQSEEPPYGQDVRDTFHRADLFVNASKQANTRAQLDRLLEIVLANPFKAPTKDEFALLRRMEQLGCRPSPAGRWARPS